MLVDRIQYLADPAKEKETIEYFLEEKDNWKGKLSPTQIVKVISYAISYFSEKKDFESALDLIDDFKDSFDGCTDKNALSAVWFGQAKCFCSVEKPTEGLVSCSRYIYNACHDTPSEEEYTVYSFRGPTEYALNDIDKSTMSFQHPYEFNDPLDTMLFRWVDGRISANRMEHWYQLKKAINHIRVRCFVSPPEPNNEIERRMMPIERIHPLMWGHYADRHHGFCIVYRIKKSFFTEKMTAPSFRLIHKEQYDSRVPDLAGDLNITEALFTKDKIWEYENEVRIIDFDMSTDENVKLVEYDESNVTIQEIYFGVNCSDEVKQKIIKSLRSKPTRIYQMEIDELNVRSLKARRIG